jgi:hypothetical protein
MRMLSPRWWITERELSPTPPLWDGLYYGTIMLLVFWLGTCVGR